MTQVDQKDFSPVQADVMSASGSSTTFHRPAAVQWLKDRTWLTFGVLRRALTKPARLFHSKGEADRTRDQAHTQKLNARHFRGGSGFF